jgi:hypothetical protein
VTTATLDLRVSAAGTNRYHIALSFTALNSAGTTQRTATISLDQQRLREHTLDPAAYRRCLTEQLFADPSLREAWISARAETHGAVTRLRVRLHLDAADTALNAIHWETLRDPAHPEGLPLVADEQIALVRVPVSATMTTLALRERDQLGLVLAVAGPHDLERFHLAAVDIPAEVARVQANLSGFAPTILARGVGSQNATLPALLAALRDGGDLLYLLAHGSTVDGTHYLWLEQPDGSAQRVSANDLAKQMAGLQRRPLLVFLAACQSGTDLSALGAQLAANGVPAVVAMQGNVTMETVAQLAPAFFAELQRDGDVERALAAARSSVPAQSDWWLPLLYSRLNDGRIWLPSGPHTVTRDLQQRSPFLALNAFTVAHAHLFFGRDALIDEGHERWLASDRRFLAVVGASGSGKSSLAMAGLIPHFERDLCELGFSTTAIILRPGERPLHALRDALRRNGLRPPTDFIKRLAEEPGLLLEALTPQALTPQALTPQALTPQPPFDKLRARSLPQAGEGEPRSGGGEGLPPTNEEPATSTPSESPAPASRVASPPAPASRVASPPAPTSRVASPPAPTSRVASPLARAGAGTGE